MVKDGRLVDVDVTVWPTRDLDGTITGASAIVRDISDLKRAERAQQATRRRCWSPPGPAA